MGASDARATALKDAGTDRSRPPRGGEIGPDDGHPHYHDHEEAAR